MLGGMDGTREKMVEIAAKLLRKQGYGAMTLVQVVDEGGLPRGSIYHHFPGGKEQLAREAIAYAASQIARDLAEVATSETASKAIQRYVNLLSDRLEASDFTDGCWYATTALEVGDNAGLREALEREFQRWTSTIAAGLQGWGVQRKHATRCAQMLIAAVEGGLLLARVRQDTSALKELVPYLQGMIETHRRE
jgi:TetR/AcrR family transcriptional repressor of lmrAB and yxaGH operons